MVEVNDIALEAPLRASHVDAVEARGGQADQIACLFPVLLQVLAPLVQGAHVIKAQGFGVEDLETIVLHGLGDVAGTGELAIGEDIAVDEAALGRLVVIRVGDVVVQHQTADLELAVHELEEVIVVLHADVLDDADGGDGIKAFFHDIAVVHEADLGQILQAFFLDLLLAPLGLLL